MQMHQSISATRLRLGALAQAFDNAQLGICLLCGTDNHHARDGHRVTCVECGKPHVYTYLDIATAITELRQDAFSRRADGRT